MPVLSTLGAAIANVYGFTSGLIKDQYFNLVSLLLPGNGTNGKQNNAFIDSSTANSGSGWSITPNGDVTQGTFSPFSQTGWGASFSSASSQYLTVGSASDWTFLHNGSTNWTIGFWFWWTGSNSSFLSTSASSSNPGINVLIDTSSFGVRIYNGSTSLEATVAPTGGALPPTNAWNYFSATLNVSTKTLTVYLNGTQIATVTNAGFSFSASASSFTLAIGRYQFATPGYYFNGYLSGVSINKSLDSTAVPTTPVTSTNGLLACQYNRFRDASTNAFTITANNGAAVTPFSPFAPTSSYSAAAVGGSGYFDGTGDYLSVADSSAFTLGTNAFTAEAWVYPTTSSTSRMIMGQYEDADNTGSFLLYLNSGNKLVCIIPALSITIIGATNVPANAWSHVVITRSGSSFAIFLNGSRDASPATNSGSLTDSTYAFTLGADRDGNNLLYTGYIASARLVNGTAVYDPTQTSITVPTAPLTAVTNTQLLLNFTNAGVVDATAKNDLQTVGNAQISTAQSKWGGGSMYFDGTGDYLQAPISTMWDLGTGDFVVEMWVYYSTSSRNGSLVSYGGYGFASADSAGWSLQINTTYGNLGFNTGTTQNIFISSNNTLINSTLPNGQWNHIAISRNGTNLRCYINGSQIGTTITNSTSLSGAPYNPKIGGDQTAAAGSLITGYIDDFRITKGSARGYTGATITVPTAPFPVQ